MTIGGDSGQRKPDLTDYVADPVARAGRSTDGIGGKDFNVQLGRTSSGARAEKLSEPMWTPPPEQHTGPSGENLFVALLMMPHPTHEFESPANPVRFSMQGWLKVEPLGQPNPSEA